MIYVTDVPTTNTVQYKTSDSSSGRFIIVVTTDSAHLPMEQAVCKSNLTITRQLTYQRADRLPGWKLAN